MYTKIMIKMCRFNNEASYMHIIVILCLCLFKEGASVGYSVERALHDYLFANYSASNRPIAEGENYYKQIVVSASFGLSQIEKLNEKEQVLTSSGYIYFSWYDELLTWDPAEFGGASLIIVPAKEIWLPEITPVNSVIGATEIASLRKVTRVRILSNGNINWIPSMKWETSCTVNVFQFPYDTQECELHFANWMFTGSLLNFTAEPEVSLEAFKPSQEWALIESVAWAEQVSTVDNGNTVTIPFLKMKLTLRRDPTFFEWNLVIPIMLLSFLIIPIFILPVESGEKVSLGVTLMLAYSIFLLMMTDVTPRSGTTPRLTIVIIVCIIISGAAILMSVIIVSIHHHNPHKPVPGWVKRLFLINLAKLLCCMNYSDKNDVKPVVFDNHGYTNDDNRKKEIKDMNFGKNYSSSELSDVLEKINFFRYEKIAENSINANKRDWNNLSRVLDRLIMVLYSVYFVVNVSSFIFLKMAYQSN